MCHFLQMEGLLWMVLPIWGGPKRGEGLCWGGRGGNMAAR